MKIAVVQNRDFSGVINQFGRKCREKYGEKTVHAAVEALRQDGHEVLLCEGDRNLLSVLADFMPPNGSGRPTGMAFNMAYGIQGECRYTHVPAALEMAGVPYTGSDPLGHALALDKVVTKDLIRLAGIPTPDYRVLRHGRDSADGLRFPVVVKPRHESTSFGLRLAENRQQLTDAVDNVVAVHQQDALVEEYVDGREVCVALLGNDPMEFLPLVEQDFGDRGVRLVTWDDKNAKAIQEPKKQCPASLSEDLASELRRISLATFRACRCKDYARVDIRIDRDGKPFVLEINSMASLGATGSYVLAARTAGYTFPGVIAKILDIAHERYFGMPAPRGEVCASEERARATVAAGQPS